MQRKELNLLIIESFSMRKNAFVEVESSLKRKERERERVPTHPFVDSREMDIAITVDIRSIDRKFVKVRTLRVKRNASQNKIEADRFDVLSLDLQGSS